MKIEGPLPGMEMNSSEYWDFRYRQNIALDYVRIDLPGFALWSGQVKNNDRVMDFGCGEGFFLQWLQMMFPTVEFHGCDISDVAKEQSMKIMRGLIWHSDLDNVEDAYFDVVFCIHTVEHFKKPEECIEMLKRILKPKGWLVVVIPYQDKEWMEHYKVWEKEDIEELFNHFDCDCEIRLRNSTEVNRLSGKPYHKKYPDDTMFMEAVCFVQFREVSK